MQRQPFPQCYTYCIVKNGRQTVSPCLLRCEIWKTRAGPCGCRTLAVRRLGKADVDIGVGLLLRAALSCNWRCSLLAVAPFVRHLRPLVSPLCNVHMIACAIAKIL